MEKNKEHMMQPDLPPQPQDELAENQQGAQEAFAAQKKKNEKSNPQGETYPLSKYNNEPSILEDIVVSEGKGKKLSNSEVDEKLDKARKIALSSDEEFKELEKADELLEQETMNAKRELAQHLLEQNQKWIQQNPMLAKVYGAEELMAMTQGDHSPMLKRIQGDVDRMSEATAKDGVYVDDRFSVAPLAFKLKDMMDKGLEEGHQLAEKKGIPPLTYKAAMAYIKSEHAEDSPLKQIYGAAGNPGVRHMSRNQAFDMYRQIYQNPMANVWNNLGKTISDSFKEFDEERARRKQERKEQFEREAKDFDDKFGGNIQTVSMSKAFDDAGKELMAREWKTEFAQLNKLKASGDISPEDYAIRTRQLMGNAQTYADSVKQIEALTSTWTEDLANGKISNGMKDEDRDLLNTLATGKGFNITTMPDGRTFKSEGMTVRNVNGQPSLVGYTSSQMATLQKEFERLNQIGEVPTDELGDQLTFDQWVSKLPQPSNADAWGALSNPPMTGDPKVDAQQRKLYSAMQGTMIPLANIQSGTGMPKILPNVKQELAAAEGQFADMMKNDQVLKLPEYSNLSPDKKWEHRGADLANQWASAIINSSDEYELASIAADYLDEELLPEEIEKMRNEKGLEEMRKEMINQLVAKVRKQVVPSQWEEETAEEKSKRVMEDAQERMQQLGEHGIRGGRGATGSRTPSASEMKFTNEQDLAREAAGLIGDVIQATPSEEELAGMNPQQRAQAYENANFENLSGRGNITLIEREIPTSWGSPTGEEPIYRITLKGRENDEPLELTHSEMEQYLRNQLNINPKYFKK